MGVFVNILQRLELALSAMWTVQKPQNTNLIGEWISPKPLIVPIALNWYSSLLYETPLIFKLANRSNPLDTWKSGYSYMLSAESAVAFKYNVKTKCLYLVC